MKLTVILVAICALAACNRNERYQVVERSNENQVEVHVVLKHNGHTYYARCNNVKAAYAPGFSPIGSPPPDRHCDLHVGMPVECQSFPNRSVTGYDLICGNRRNEKTGNLDAYGENELLTIDREVN